MENIEQWLRHTDADDPPIDPRLFEDIDFEEWLGVDRDLGSKGDGDEGKKTNDDATPGAEQEQPKQPDPSVAEMGLMQSTQKPSTALESAPTPRQVDEKAIMIQASSPDQGTTNWQPSPDPKHQSFEALCEPLPGDLRSQDLFRSNTTHQDPDLFTTTNQPPDLNLAQSPSHQYQYPDPTLLGTHYTNAQTPASHVLVTGPYPPEAQPTTTMTPFDHQYYPIGGGGQDQMFVPQQTDFSFSPPVDFGTPLFPEGGDFDDLEPPARRTRQSKGKGRASSTVTGDAPKGNPNCVDCGKKYRTSSSPGRCTRCGAKYERRVAQPFTFTMDSSVPDFGTARRMIFSPIPGRYVQKDDVHRYIADPGSENRFVQHLLDSINVVQSLDEGWDDWSVRQQKTFNEKAKLEVGYSNALVTARLRALYREILNYHLGGDAVYAVGGDNSGYADEKTLRFSQRMAFICEVLKKNKRVVMDVIEGRGVQGFVSNPKKYHERKASNNNCNVEKKRIMEKGKELEAELGSVTTMATRRGKRARTVDVEGSPGVEEVGEGPAGKRLRGVEGEVVEQQQQPMYWPEWDGGYGPGKPMQAVWLDCFGRPG